MAPCEDHLHGALFAKIHPAVLEEKKTRRKKDKDKEKNKNKNNNKKKKLQ